MTLTQYIGFIGYRYFVCVSFSGPLNIVKSESSYEKKYLVEY